MVLSMFVKFMTFIAIFIVLLIFVSMTSCFVRISRENAPLEEVMPWGVWAGDEPDLTLFILPEYRLPPRVTGNTNSFPVVYTFDGHERRLIAVLSTHLGMIGRYRSHFLIIRELCPYGFWETFLRFNGEGFEDGFRVVNGELHLSNRSEETMILRQIIDHEPIDIEYWNFDSE